MTTRRQFIEGITLLTLGSIFPSCRQPPVANNQVVILDENVTNLALNLLRPLSRSVNGSPQLTRDRELLDKLEGWLKNILLGRKDFSLMIDRNNVYQICNLTPNCNGYVVHITDQEILKRIVSEGEIKTSRTVNLLTKLSPDKILWGNFHWLRLLKRDQNKKSDLNAYIVEEIYWLDLIYQVGDLALPVIRVHYDSIGLVSFEKLGYTNESLQRELSQTPYFVESNTIILDWHELAERLQLTDNLHYLRCCFTGSNVNTDVIGKNTSTQAFSSPVGSRPIIVYRRDGDYERISNSGPTHFDINRPYSEQISPFSSMKLSNLRSVDLTNISEFSFTELDTEPRPTIPVPSSVVFPEESRAGQDFIFFVSNQFRGVRYERQGHFSITLEMSEPSAAGRRRGSGFVAGAVTAVIVGAGPGAVIAAGVVGGGAGIALGEAIKTVRQSDPERQRRRRRVLELAEVCAGTSSTEAECHECVEMTGDLEAERSDLAADAAIEIATEIGVGAAIGCGGGALVGAAFAGVGAGPGCAIGAVVGFLIGGGAAVLDYLSYEEAVNKLENEAFSPCDSRPGEMNF